MHQVVRRNTRKVHNFIQYIIDSYTKNVFFEMLLSLNSAEIDKGNASYEWEQAMMINWQVSSPCWSFKNACLQGNAWKYFFFLKQVSPSLGSMSSPTSSTPFSLHLFLSPSSAKRILITNVWAVMWRIIARGRWRREDPSPYQNETGS